MCAGEHARACVCVCKDKDMAPSWYMHLDWNQILFLILVITMDRREKGIHKVQIHKRLLSAVAPLNSLRHPCCRASCR